MSADAFGHLPPWAFPTDCGTPPGTYLIWVIDQATGRISNVVTETVTASPDLPVSMSFTRESYEQLTRPADFETGVPRRPSVGCPLAPFR